MSQPPSAHLLWKFVPSAGTCNQCRGCAADHQRPEVEVNGLLANQLVTAGPIAEAGLPAIVTIRDGKMLSVLWHALLLPLSGFVSGAVAGYSVFQTEITAIGGAVAGLILAACLTQPIQDQSLSIELVSDFKTPEKTNR